MFPRFPILPLAIVLAVGSVSVATTFHLDADSPTATGDGRSPATAWKTLLQLQKATLQPGDSVVFKRGARWTNDSLMLQARHGGSAQQPVVVSVYGNPSDPPPHLENSGRLLGLWRASHMVLEGLHLSGARAACLEIGDTGSHHVVVRDIEADSCGAGIEINKARDVVVSGCFLHDMKMIKSTQGAEGTVEADDDYGAMGLVLAGAQGCEIRENRFRNCRAPSFDYGFDGGAVEAWGGVKDCEIHRNRAEYTDGFMEFGGQPSDTVRNVRVHHNLALETGGFSWIHVLDTTGRFGMSYDGLRIEYNTTRTRNRSVGFFFGGGGKLADPEQISIRHNILVADTVRGGVYYKPPYAIGNNLVWCPKNPFTNTYPAAPGDRWLDPMFVSDTDLSLQATSPARDAGVPRGYTMDFQGKSAWRGTAPDQGAFEFQAGEDHVEIRTQARPRATTTMGRWNLHGARVRNSTGPIDLSVPR